METKATVNSALSPWRRRSFVIAGQWWSCANWWSAAPDSTNCGRVCPRMSPALLSKRLKELEVAGVIEHVPSAEPGVFEYRLTEAGRDLRNVVEAVGIWGQRWVRPNPACEISIPAC